MSSWPSWNTTSEKDFCNTWSVCTLILQMKMSMHILRCRSPTNGWRGMTPLRVNWACVILCCNPSCQAETTKQKRWVCHAKQYSKGYRMWYSIGCHLWCDVLSWHKCTTLQACGRIDRGHGLQNLDIHLLKPARFQTDANSPMQLLTDMLHNENIQPAQEWIRYAYRTSHPVLRFLPTKLAEFIGENYASELGIPPKTDRSK